MTIAPDTANSLYSTLTNVAQEIADELVPGKKYLYTADIGSWVAQGTDDAPPTASAGVGSMYVPAGYVLTVLGGRGTTLSVLRAGGANGNASLTPYDVV